MVSAYNKKSLWNVHEYTITTIKFAMSASVYGGITDFRT